MPMNLHFIERVVHPCAYECFKTHNVTDWATPIREFIEMGDELRTNQKPKG